MGALHRALVPGDLSALAEGVVRLRDVFGGY